MKRLMFILALITPAVLAAPSALATPFASGDAAAGKALHEKKCAACHAGRFGGDGSAIYTRSDRRVKNAGALAQQITVCNSIRITSYNVCYTKLLREFHTLDDVDLGLGSLRLLNRDHSLIANLPHGFSDHLTN